MKETNACMITIESIIDSLNQSEKCGSPQCRISYYTDIQHLMIKFDKEIRKNILKSQKDVYKEWADRQMSNRVRRNADENVDV